MLGKIAEKLNGKRYLSLPLAPITPWLSNPQQTWQHKNYTNVYYSATNLPQVGRSNAGAPLRPAVPLDTACHDKRQMLLYLPTSGAMIGW